MLLAVCFSTLVSNNVWEMFCAGGGGAQVMSNWPKAKRNGMTSIWKRIDETDIHGGNVNKPFFSFCASVLGLR